MENNNTNFWIYNASAGSGKTYTLVQKYLEMIRQKPDAYKHLLAMTFTNKAANELKMRILEALNEKEKNVLNKILEDYSNFNITTLDAFTHKIVRNFAKDLGIPSQFEVLLDSQELIHKAVENLISKIGTEKYITKILMDFALYKTADDKSWDISKELQKIAEILLKEDDFQQVKKLEPYDFEHFPLKKIREKNEVFKKELQKIAEKGWKIIEQEGLKKNDFYYGDFFNFLNNVKNCDFEKFNFNGRLDENIHSGKIRSKKSKINEQIEDDFLKIYEQIKNLYNEKYKDFYLGTALEKHWVPLAVLQEIKKEMDLLKLENNVQLNAEFNKIIRENIKNLPSPFIYERLSQWISYFFIDEMQDTSLLQWENLIPLIKDSLDSKQQGKLFLVGDAKQSIYRWRGGHPEQFIKLTENENPFGVEKNLENLPKNWRSYSEIVKFNNDFFSSTANDFENEIHKKLYKVGNSQKCNDKKGGYVSLEFLEAKNMLTNEKETLLYPEKIAKKIKKITNVGYQKNEICILVRKRKHGNFIANYLIEHKIKVASSETLLIKNSKKVCFLEAFLKIFENPEDKKLQFFVLEYIYQNHENLKKEIAFYDFYKEKKRDHAKFFIFNLREFFKKPLPKNFWELPLYEQVTALVNTFGLVAKSDAYVEGFLELLFEFSQKKSGAVVDFLNFWEQKKDSESIIAPQDEDSVQMMTVHKSKGLEFPVVIFAYDLDISRDLESYFWYENKEMLKNYGLPNFRLPQKKANDILGKDVEKIYEKHKQERIFDNINILYVALTRAKEQLHIITDLNEKKTMFSGKFISFLKDKNIWKQGQNCYDFGTFKKYEKQEKTQENTLEIPFLTYSWETQNLLLFTKKEEHIKANKGILWHGILSEIFTQEDIKKTLEKFILKEKIQLSEKQNFQNLLRKIIQHSELKNYFSSSKEIYTEIEITDENGAILIPDRLIFEGKNVTILDYKTGEESLENLEQIKKYGVVLEKMGYCVVCKFLIYLDVEKFEIAKIKQI